jgi:hypothetical protein
MLNRVCLTDGKRIMGAQYVRFANSKWSWIPVPEDLERDDVEGLSASDRERPLGCEPSEFYGFGAPMTGPWWRVVSRSGIERRVQTPTLLSAQIRSGIPRASIDICERLDTWF